MDSILPIPSVLVVSFDPMQPARVAHDWLLTEV